MPKLTIVLGKSIGRLTDVGLPAAKVIFFPELELVNVGRGPTLVPCHPDNFVPTILEWVKQLMEHGKDVQLWTMSEYLVSWLAQDVGKGLIASPDVEVRLYDDTNTAFRRFGIAEDGILSDTGDGHWPYGWFLPTR